MIRSAVPEDIPALLEMGRAFHAASEMPFRFDEAVMAEILADMIHNDRASVLMTDRGVIGGALNAAYCDPKWIYAVELFWWAKGDGLGLLRAFEGWARQAGASEIRMTSLASLPRADRLLKAVGYVPAEISYSRRL